MVRKSVLFFGLQEKLLEDRMVQVSRTDDKPSATASDADCDVAGRNIGGSITTAASAAARGGGDASLLTPALEHLADADDAADVVGFYDSGGHCK